MSRRTPKFVSVSHSAPLEAWTSAPTGLVLLVTQPPSLEISDPVCCFGFSFKGPLSGLGKEFSCAGIRPSAFQTRKRHNT